MIHVDAIHKIKPSDLFTNWTDLIRQFNSLTQWFNCRVSQEKSSFQSLYMKLVCGFRRCYMTENERKGVRKK